MKLEEGPMHRIAFAVASILGIFIALPALAEGEIVITQAKALAGNVTPGDTAGFPVTLSRAGAYVMASNLTVPSGSYGFYITANNVDLDMNGFVLSGGGVGNYGLVSHLYGESRIHDGVISGFRSYGIYVRASGWTIEDMQIVRNGGSGIDAMNTTGITVQNSVIASNGAYGAVVRKGVFRNNTVTENANIGIYIDRGGYVEGNYIENNFKGISIDGGGVITANSIIANQSYGIENGSLRASISNNSLVDNNGIGAEQIFGGVNAYGNTCVGKPC
jgi:hypothetical protein